MAAPKEDLPFIGNQRDSQQLNDGILPASKFPCRALESGHLLINKLFNV